MKSTFSFEFTRNTNVQGFEIHGSAAPRKKNTDGRKN